MDISVFFLQALLKIGNKNYLLHFFSSLALKISQLLSVNYVICRLYCILALLRFPVSNITHLVNGFALYQIQYAWHNG